MWIVGVVEELLDLIFDGVEFVVFVIVEFLFDAYESVFGVEVVFVVGDDFVVGIEGVGDCIEYCSGFEDVCVLMMIFDGLF